MCFRYVRLVKGAAGGLLSPWFPPVSVRRGDQICESRYDLCWFRRFSSGGNKQPVLLSLCFNTFFCSSFLCRRRGAVYHAGHTDDDGGLVDVCSHCHLLVHGQPSSLPHHHAHRELHTVSILEIVFPTNSVWKLINIITIFQPNDKSENVNSPELEQMKLVALIGRIDLLPISHMQRCQK